jgi:hypothetical protein
MNTKKRLERLEKELGSDSFSVIPQAERVVAVSGLHARRNARLKMKPSGSPRCTAEVRKLSTRAA